jgi:hypothetical protein
MTIIEGNTGKIFWTGKFSADKTMSSPFFSEHLLLNELFKPVIDKSVNELQTFSL